MRLIKRIIKLLPKPLSLALLNSLSVFLPKARITKLRTWWYNKFYTGEAIKHQDIVYYLHPDDVVSRQIFMLGYFDNHVLHTLLHFMKQSQSFLDVGANIGAMSLNIAKHSTIPILALEPVSSNFALLEKNIQANKLNIQAKQVAVGAEDGETLIYLAEKNHGDHRLGLMEGEERPSETIKIQRLDACIAGTNLQAPYLVKIDVQGFEPYVLQGATSLLKAPCYIVMEVWPNGLEMCGSTVEALDQICKSADLIIYQIHDDGSFTLSESLMVLTEPLPDIYGAHIDVLLTNQPISL
jgi:FkbM family methyltransferase